MRSAFAGHIYYETFVAEGDWVVFCHGLGGNHAVWFQQVPVFSEKYRVLTWDQRGFGRSLDAGPPGPGAAVDDLLSLLDQEEISRAHVIGQSMGGWAALGLALREPARVHSLVLADTTAGVSNDAIAHVMTTTERREVDQTKLGRHPALGEGLDRTKAFLYQELGGFRGEIDEAELIGKLFSTRHSLEDVAALRVPTLCVVGKQDDLMPPAAIHEVASLIHDAKVVEIADAGHSPYFEQPEAWNSAVLDFLDSR